MQAAALWQDLDYYQPHAYPPEPLGAIARIDNLRLGKPYFFGEIGPGGGRDDGDFLHRALWGSLMSQSSGAAQYWYWDRMQQPAFAQQLRAAARFVSASKMPDQAGLRQASVRVECEAKGPLEIGPGGEWGQGGQTEFTVQPSGEVPGIAEMPRYLHGTGHADLFRGCTFHAALRRARQVRGQRVADRQGWRASGSLVGRHIGRHAGVPRRQSRPECQRRRGNRCAAG